MYGYNNYKPITKEEILLRVSEENIFGIVINEPISIEKGACYRAPYRSDENADCYFEYYDNKLCFVDHASNPKSVDAIGMIMKCANLSFVKALEYINGHFSLGLGNNSSSTKEVFIKNDHVEEEKIVKSFKERVITLLPRQFGYKDKQFWSKYGISSQNLIDDGVIAVQMYRSTSKYGKYFTINCMDICYAYTDFEDGKMKIYRPYGNKDSKWFTNCNQNDIGSYRHLPESGELLIVTKSYKDCRVIRNLGLNSCWFQSEGMIPHMDLLRDLCKRFKKIIVWFDNDSAGITNSRILVEIFNTIEPNKASSIMLPPRLLKESIKDPSDYYANKGKEQLIDFLVTKTIIKI